MSPFLSPSLVVWKTHPGDEAENRVCELFFSVSLPTIFPLTVTQLHSVTGKASPNDNAKKKREAIGERAFLCLSLPLPVLCGCFTDFGYIVKVVSRMVSPPRLMTVMASMIWQRVCQASWMGRRWIMFAHARGPFLRRPASPRCGGHSI